jgi:hypothetical protein
MKKQTIEVDVTTTNRTRVTLELPLFYKHIEHEFYYCVTEKATLSVCNSHYTGPSFNTYRTLMAPNEQSVIITKEEFLESVGKNIEMTNLLINEIEL